jgi:hypothetical protein
MHLSRRPLRFRGERRGEQADRQGDHEDEP